MLDEMQRKAVETNGNILIIAGPGSGKTKTIIEKANFLLNIYQEDEILFISFTNKSANDIKNKLNNNIKVLTFHKLAIDILKTYNYTYTLCPQNYLDYIIKEYLITCDKETRKTLNKYIKDKYSINFIKTFINLYKTNGYNSNNILKKANAKDKRILKILTNIIYTYEEEKKANNFLDYDDLIIKATNLLKQEYKYYNFKEIIIDEFQDTSIIRLNLIKQVTESTKSHICAVGDDAQSIFHFTGCDLTIFLNFTKYFSNAKILMLKNTYRNSKYLINKANTFINKNPNQIKKHTKSNINIKKPIIYKYYLNPHKILTKLLDKLIFQKETNIFIISRNKKDIYNYLNSNITYQDDIVHYKNLKIPYLTVHSSKGLEEDIVIVLNMSNNSTGFPNKIKNPRLIEYICPLDKYPYAEERRLFYVAITRCKKKVYLLVPYLNPSIFIKELKKG